MRVSSLAARFKFALALLVLAICTVPAQANPPDVLKQWNGDHIQWLGYDAGARKARETGKRMLVVFYTTWCPHCTRYRKQFFDPRVTALSEKLVMVLVDRDTQPGINKRYDRFGRYIPRTMVLNSKARLLPEIRGLHPEYPFFLDTNHPEDLLRLMTLAAGQSG
ncbi:thioredoxin family protein [uncultured Roseibium sp.]|uniref:thioredoxin family protein n=1 Tax=uncultured Roseibium sp. TaxID=1936171 RepID=UPI0032173F1D